MVASVAGRPSIGKPCLHLAEGFDNCGRGSIRNVLDNSLVRIGCASEDMLVHLAGISEDNLAKEYDAGCAVIAYQLRQGCVPLY
jgi:hypothetical protein